MTVALVAWAHLALAGLLLTVTAALLALPDAPAVALVVSVTLASAHGIAGLGLLARAPWSRPLALALAALQAVNVPVGTALAAVTFFTLVRPDSMSAPRGSSARVAGGGVAALVVGAAAVPLMGAAIVALSLAFAAIVAPSREATPTEAAASCQLSDLPGGLTPNTERFETSGAAISYEGVADGVTMTSMITKADFAEDLRAESDGLNLHGRWFGWRHGVDLTQQAGVPFHAEHGHWAAGSSAPGVTLDLIHGDTRVIVGVAGARPADLAELEAWFGRCVAAAQALPIEG